MKKQTTQHAWRPGKGLRSLAACLLTLTGFTALSQPCNNVSSLDINTGYDYTANNPVAANLPDPEWIVTDLTPACAAVSGAVPVGTNARVVTTGVWALSNPNSRWISFLNSGGYVAASGQPVMDFGMSLSRNFKVCQADSFLVTLNIANDNFCTQIDIDGTPIAFSQPAGLPAGNYSTFTAITPFTVYLSPGIHSLNVRVHNFPNGSGGNPHGLNLLGNIQSSAGITSLVGPGSPLDCVCTSDPGCSDTCYWKVSGNQIIGNNNIFGTLTRDNVRIKTAAADRGIFTSDGLLGWNTMSPTAYLHVYCEGHNKEDGKISDVRFERLEAGTGNILVINEQGYVLDSKIPISRANAALEIETLKQNYEAEKERNDRLEKELAEIKAKVNLLLEHKAGPAATSRRNELYQNTPNPFKEQTVITYNIFDMKREAHIVIVSASGQTVSEYKISHSGYGQITIDNHKLTPGTYFYSLVVDQETAETRKMILK